MKYELLENKEFEKDLYNELDNATKRCYLQFLTFEGDKTGLTLANKLISLKQKNVDIKVLIDRYTDLFVSDKPVSDKSVREEVISTKNMIKDMKDAGIEVERTRSLGPMKIFWTIRNHKKIIVIDDVCYLGGINISDHNFSWDDFMVKIKDKEIVSAVTEDFEYTFSGKERNYKYKNLMTNEYLSKTYYDLLENAEKEVIISSAYLLDLPTVNMLKNKIKNKKETKILTLKQSNWEAFNQISGYLNQKLIEEGIEVYHYKKFSHAKFMIVDRKKILIGSLNFGEYGLKLSEEIGILIEDKNFVKKFIEVTYTDKKSSLEKASGLNANMAGIVMAYVYYVFLLSQRIIRKLFGRWQRVVD